MSKYVQSVIDLSEKITSKSTYVWLNTSAIGRVAKTIPPPLEESFWGVPSHIVNLEEDENTTRKLTILYKLLASSVNYCYWYGKADIRPNNSGSTLMYEMLSRAFSETSQYEGAYYRNAKKLQANLLQCRMPMLRERFDHIQEFIDADGGDLSKLIESIANEEPIDDVLSSMFILLPGFAEDLFLKRVFLFFMQINRRLGLYEDAMSIIPVPADYQVPKILEHKNCILYSGELINDIHFGIHIPRMSMKEIEIRAATILGCNALSIASGYTQERIDDFLWMKRKESTKPFHLTVTTDY